MLYKDIEIIKNSKFNMDIDFVTALGEPINIKGSATNDDNAAIQAVSLKGIAVSGITNKPAFTTSKDSNGNDIFNKLKFSMSATETNKFAVDSTNGSDVYGHPDHTYAYCVLNWDGEPILRGKIAVVGSMT